MDHNTFITHHKYGLRFFGASRKNNCLAGFYCGVGIMLFFLIFEIWNITEVYNDLETLMDNLIATIGVIGGLAQMISFQLEREKLIRVSTIILDDLKNSQHDPASRVMMENFILSQTVSKLLIILFNAMNVTYFAKTILSYIFDPVEDRKFLAEITLPIDGRKSPVYEIVILGQFITASICFNSLALIDGFLAVLVLHACSKVEIVKIEIIKFSKACQISSQDVIVKTALKKLLLKHMEFLEFSKNVQDIFSYVSFWNITMITLLQVVAGYMFIDALGRKVESVNLIHYAILIISFLITSGYFCVVGEYLTKQSETIFNQLCDCAWYELTIHCQKEINFILSKARKPVHVTAGKFFKLSLVLFTKIMKTSFSYLSIVRAIR